MSENRKKLVQDGVRLSVKGVDKFIRDLDRATAAIDRFSAAVKRVDSIEMIVNNWSIDSATFDTRLAAVMARMMRSR